MALRVSIIPLQRAFLPGGLLTARVEVANHSDTLAGEPFDIQVAEFSVRCTGTERVDRTWVAAAYGAHAPAVEKQNRRETRVILQSERALLGGSFRLAPGQERAWTVGLQLPPTAPPSFRGTAVKHGYLLTAAIRFSASPAAMQLLTQHLSLDPSKRGGSQRSSLLLTLAAPRPGRQPPAPSPTAEQAAEARTPVLVLPLQRLQEELLERSSGSAGVATGEEAELGAIEYPLQLGPDIPVEAQEVGAEAAQQAAPVGQALPRGVSLSRSDVQARPDGAPPLLGSIRPIDAWPQPAQPPAEAGGPSFAPVDAHLAGRPPPLRPATPLTGGEGGAHRSFNLRLADCLLVRLALHPPRDRPLCPGATLAGTLDFRGSQEAAARDAGLPKCVQVVVLLETEERVQQLWASGSAAAGPGVRKVLDEHQQLTPDTLLTHFMLTIPPDAPASFASHLVALRWLLRFELTTSRRQAGGGWLLGGGAAATERLTWTLPVLVQPAR